MVQGFSSKIARHGFHCTTPKHVAGGHHSWWTIHRNSLSQLVRDFHLAGSVISSRPWSGPTVRGRLCRDTLTPDCCNEWQSHVTAHFKINRNVNLFTSKSSIYRLLAHLRVDLGYKWTVGTTSGVWTTYFQCPFVINSVLRAVAIHAVLPSEIEITVTTFRRLQDSSNISITNLLNYPPSLSTMNLATAKTICPRRRRRVADIFQPYNLLILRATPSTYS